MKRILLTACLLFIYYQNLSALSLSTSGDQYQYSDKDSLLLANTLTGHLVQSVPAISAAEVLKGKMPGVYIVRGNCKPGYKPSIRLRGLTGVIQTNSAPIVIVDGVIIDRGYMDIDGLDIKRIEVLKGPSSAAMFGSRGANGVIKIYTNRGQYLKQNETRIRVRNELGFNKYPTKRYWSEHHEYKLTPDGKHYMDEDGNPTDDYLEAALDAKDKYDDFTAFQDNNFPEKTYDHIDQFFNAGSFLSSSIQIARNTQKTNLTLSFNYTKDRGIIKGLEGSWRKYVRLNLDSKLSKSLNLSSNIYYTNSWNDDPEGMYNPFESFNLARPIANFYEGNRDGTPYNVQPDPTLPYINPLYLTHNQDLDFNRSRFMGNINLTWKPLNDLDIKADISHDRLSRFDEKYYFNGFKIINKSNKLDSLDGHYERFHSKWEETDVSLSARIRKSLWKISTETGFNYNYEFSDYNTTSASGDSLAVNGLHDIDVAQKNITAHSSKENIISHRYSLFSQIGYENKYFAHLLILREGCSLFGETEQWQTYYGSSLSWQITNEKWWPIEWIDKMNLHYAYGTAGVRPPFGAKYEKWIYADSSYHKSVMGNKYLKPARSAEHEIGLMVRFLDRFSMNIVYAHTTTKDIIRSNFLIGCYGYDYQWTNDGTIKSHSIEADIKISMANNSNLEWEMGFMFDMIRQKITRLDTYPFRTEYTVFFREGESVGAIYGYRLITKKSQLPKEWNPEVFDKNDDGYLVPVGKGNSWKDGIRKNLWGKEVYVDYSKKIKLDWGIPIIYPTSNITKIGDTTPDFTCGLNAYFRWKGLSFYALFHAQIGGDVYNYKKQIMYYYRVHKDCDQYGKPDSRKKPIRYYYKYNPSIYTPLDTFVEDGSYLKLREIAIKYTLNRSTLKKFAQGVLGTMFHTITFGIIGRNILTIAGYSGFDPEVGIKNATIIRKENFVYPHYRTISGLIEIEF